MRRPTVDRGARDDPATQSSSAELDGERVRRVLAWRARLMQTALGASGVAHIAGALLYVVTDPNPLVLLIAVVGGVGLLHLVARYALGSYASRALLFVLSLGIEIGWIGAVTAWTPAVVLLAVFGTVFAGLLLGRGGAVALPLLCAAYLVAGSLAVQAGWSFPVQTTLDSPAAWGRVAAMFACLTGITAAALRHVLHLLDALHEEASLALRKHEQETARLQTSRSSRRATEQLIRDAQKLQTISQISGGLAHLLNNTMTVVRTAAEELACAPSNDDVRRCARLVTEAVQRATTTTTDLLAFSRRDQPEAQPISLEKELETLRETFVDALPESVTLDCKLRPTPLVLAEPVRIRQLALNLVLNARDAIAGRGEIVLETDTVEVDAQSPPDTAQRLMPGRYVVLTVTDTGGGMEIDVAPRAYEPFFTTKDSAEHEGLGLFVVFGLLEQWGGSLSIQSAPERGTVVTVYLPVAAEPEAPTREPEASEVTPEAQDAPLRPPPTVSDRAPSPRLEEWKEASLRRVVPVVALVFGVAALVGVLLGRVTEYITAVGCPIAALINLVAWRVRCTPRWVLLGTMVATLGTLTSLTILANGYMSPAAVAAHAVVVLVVAVYADRAATAAALVVLSLTVVAGALGPLGGTWHDDNVTITDPQNWLRISVLLPIVLFITSGLVLDILHTATTSLQTLEHSLERLERSRRERENEDTSLLTIQDVAVRATRLETIGRIAGGVAHDLNNTLTGVLGWASLLEDDPDAPPEDRRAAIEAFHEAVDFADALVSQLEPHSPAQSSRGKSSDLSLVVERSHSLLKHLVREHIELDLDLKSGCFAPISSTDLRRVLMNFATNARDAMPEGGRLSLRTYRDPTGEWVILEIEDTGIGMTKETRRHVFDAFFTTKPEGHGTGLGLHTVARIVRATEGRIKLDTTPGRGTRFTLRWPRVVTASHPSTPPPVIPGGHRGVILLAEDNEWVRHATMRGLQRAGYEVIAAVDGTDACSKMDSRQWDALCTDAVMPGESSTVVIERFSERFPGRPIVLCSGHLPRDVQALATSKLVRFVPKPYGPSTLVKVLDEELARVTVRARTHPVLSPLL